ncbi:hypothetical protein AG1IA_06969 [Rhizoctonia solani AG-1 IA]|uniref:Uncharacterized protein n=1 Tax=Thanatephorus cucumeris (strain AG1-IA) TaxID=983506 RepID=L8WQF7_THACA|nr:hypothetical protein AG1IA_06969 [Rhizoctonia solani AG-1 IA]
MTYHFYVLSSILSPNPFYSSRSTLRCHCLAPFYLLIYIQIEGIFIINTYIDISGCQGYGSDKDNTAIRPFIAPSAVFLCSTASGQVFPPRPHRSRKNPNAIKCDTKRNDTTHEHCWNLRDSSAGNLEAVAARRLTNLSNCPNWSGCLPAQPPPVWTFGLLNLEAWGLSSTWSESNRLNNTTHSEHSYPN